VPSGETTDFSAVGVYNQFIYVSPKNRMTVVMLSANSGYGARPDGATDYEFEAAVFLRTLVEAQN
jgi:CubicO group peptidase (beta-lactamase class C family)